MHKTVAYLKLKGIGWAPAKHTARDDRKSRAAMLSNAIDENQRKEMRKRELETLKEIIRKYNYFG